MKIIAHDPNSSNKGHYSPGVISHGMLYISGQLPINPETGKIQEGDISAQTQRTLLNVERILNAAGLNKENVVQCRIYIPDMKFWDTINDIYSGFFGTHKPARVIVPSRELHNEALVEIEAIAELEAE
ncbi:MAG: RidA family protein [Clostridiaceae bacterium]|nr:RidA family protein [Clostridiaceae bacterium]